jgi:uncharacterized protein (TIGR00251 family)
MNIPYKKTKEGILVSVKVEPRSSVKGFAGILDETMVKIKLTAPPSGGAANRQLIEVISDATGIKKSQIEIIKGFSSKKKIIAIKGVDSL